MNAVLLLQVLGIAVAGALAMSWRVRRFPVSGLVAEGSELADGPSSTVRNSVYAEKWPETDQETAVTRLQPLSPRAPMAAQKRGGSQ